MARTEELGYGETRTCGFCGESMAQAMGDTQYVVVGEAEETWHTGCAEDVGIPVELDEDGHDPEYDYDPEYDGAEDEDGTV